MIIHDLEQEPLTLEELLRLASEATSGLPWLSALLSPDRWLLWLGLLFVLSVYYFPTGIVGKLRAMRVASASRRPPAAGEPRHSPALE